MKIERIKKVLVTLLAAIMITSYMSGLLNASVAAEGSRIENWHDYIRSYMSIAYEINGKVQPKWLFYDTRGIYQNLNCIRSGSSQDTTYIEHDLYRLKETNPTIFNELFKGSNLTDAEANRNYYHVMWEIENFYLFNDADTQADKNAKFAEYNNFIGASSTPYNATETTSINLWKLGSSKWLNDKITLTKNELLVKALQNEMLLPYVVQTYGRPSNLSQVYDVNYIPGVKTEYTKVNSNVQNYVNLIKNKFTTITNSDGYSLGNNINYYFYSEPEKAKVHLRSNSENADTTNNISGSFYVTNKFKAEVTGINVYINNVKKTDFKILDANGNEVTNYLNAFTNSASNSEYEFKVYWNGLNTGDNTVRVELNVDYGDIITATLLEPVNKGLETDSSGNKKGCQYVININKDHKTETVRAEGDTSAKEFDLALTKQVVKVITPSNEETEYARAYYIDDATLKTGKTTNARYVMSKQLVHVEPECRVIYSIKVFNEGEIDGFAEEITDYLPEYLTLAQNSEINNEYGWVDNGDGTISTTFLSSNGNPSSTNIIKAYTGSLSFDDGKEIKLECIVDENATNGQRIDNRAEISKYGYYADTNADSIMEFIEASSAKIDRDSIQNSVTEDAEVENSNNIVEDLINLIEGIISGKIGYIERKDDKNKISYEDDDDIERLYVVNDIREMDLALRKWITKVDDTEYDREPSQLEGFEEPSAVFARQCLQQGTLDYDNPKEAITLKVGSVVTYKLAIFNEGTAEAYAQEVTDYLPAGLEFIADNETNIANGWTATKNSDGTTTVKTNILSEQNGTIVENNRNSNMLIPVLDTYGDKLAEREGRQSYKIIEIVCKVSEDVAEEKYLTNRAEITEYGYYTKNKEFVTATEEGIDRDSIQDTIKDNLKLDDWYSIAYLDVFNADTPQISFPGEEDDDDFETVYVEIEEEEEPEITEYSIQIKKVSSEDEAKTIAGAIFKITNTSTKESKESDPTNETGITSLLSQIVIDNTTTDTYEITETYVPDMYKLYEGTIKLTVCKKLKDNKYILDTSKTKVEGENVELSVNGSIITITVTNPEKEFDLALRKFITSINGSKLEGEDSRVPQVDGSTLINGDPKKNGEKTATYTHTKEPVLVNPTDIVEYTLRIYNEGELDGYASRIIDDVPEGVTMVAPKYDEDGIALNTNAKYRWTMYKEMSEEDINSEETTGKSVLRYDEKYYVETENAEEAVLISTDYLSMENGEKMMSEEDTVNPNLILAFTGSRLYFKDIKVEFEVKPTKDVDKIITNYAQISEHEYKDGTPITDRDSTPNVWKENEDDQDIENLKVNWFDLALYKWVSSTIVTEEGKTKEYASEHTQDNKDAIVNVTIAKDKLDKTTVKFKWQIKVENQGTIAGYATELKDHIPTGLKFVAEDNKDFGWELQEDGTVTTDYLKDTLLQPGETAEVTIVLTWINSADNMGVKVNYAEISEDFNAYKAPDIDSTPDNFTGKPVEDDEDQDEVRLNVRTGSGIIVEYILTVVGCMAVIATGVVLVKKNVLDKEF